MNAVFDYIVIIIASTSFSATSPLPRVHVRHLSHHHLSISFCYQPATDTTMEPTTHPTHPPKDDPFTDEDLAQYDGSDANKPVYVCIKGKHECH